MHISVAASRFMSEITDEVLLRGSAAAQGRDGVGKIELQIW